MKNLVIQMILAELEQAGFQPNGKVQFSPDEETAKLNATPQGQAALLFKRFEIDVSITSEQGEAGEDDHIGGPLAVSATANITYIYPNGATNGTRIHYIAVRNRDDINLMTDDDFRKAIEMNHNLDKLKG